MFTTRRPIAFWAFSVICFLTLSLQSEAITVNRLNGGGSVVYVDFSIPGSVVPLELVRTYNSITAVSEPTGWNGALGWGWTTPFETTLTITPERTVLLRDGSTGNNVFFKTEKEDPKVRDAFFEKMKKAYYEQKIGRKLTDAELAKMQMPDKMLSRLKNDPAFRVELAMKFGVKGVVPRGELLVSSEFGYQTLQFKNNQWIRERDGIVQYFDGEGRLTRQKDKNGFFFDYSYSKTQKQQVREIAAQDKTSTLKFTWRGDRIIEVVDNRSRKSRYSYDAVGNLVQVVDGNGIAYAYKYENKKFPHLLTRIDYLTEGTAKERPYREVRYDDNGLIVFHREKDGTENTLLYGKKPNDPDNNFWTKSSRKGKGINEEQYDEFFIKSRADGSRYLYKQESKLNGASTLTLFAPCCNKPTQITKNGEVTTFKYYDNGLLSEKVGPKEDIRLEYDPRWKKITKVNQNGFVSTYEYDEHGNLVKAANSKNQRVALKYDRLGRIAEMVDPEGKQITFKYGDQGKPVYIAEKGVGILKINYDGEGRITRTETGGEGNRKPSEAKSQEVVRKVMKSFQELLEIIRPAGVSLINNA